jgi:DNA-binding response OmpR family regulator
MKTILIIDDDQDLCEELEDRVAAMGHEAMCVHSQWEALAVLAKCDVAIALILLDLEIPVKPEGPTRRETGLNLLYQLKARPGMAPIIVMTSHGKGNHLLCLHVMQHGAAGFIGKPFDEEPPEGQIKRILSEAQPNHPLPGGPLRPFGGGDMVVHETHIDLAGIEIGGVKVGTIIRRVITVIATKPGTTGRRMSAKSLSDALGNVEPASVTSAINDFRNQCTDKMAAKGWSCGKQDVIETALGGGYRFREWITVREGSDVPKLTQVEVDADLVMGKFAGRTSLTRRQINDAVGIPALRVKAALARLVEQKHLRLVSGSGATTTYGKIAPSP